MKDPFAALVLGQANDQGREQCSSSFKCVSRRKAAADSYTLHILKASFNPKHFHNNSPHINFSISISFHHSAFSLKIAHIPHHCRTSPPQLLYHFKISLRLLTFPSLLLISLRLLILCKDSSSPSPSLHLQALSTVLKALSLMKFFRNKTENLSHVLPILASNGKQNWV
jgi:hypothetical protein